MKAGALAFSLNWVFHRCAATAAERRRRRRSAGSCGRCGGRARCAASPAASCVAADLELARPRRRPTPTRPGTGRPVSSTQRWRDRQRAERGPGLRDVGRAPARAGASSSAASSRQLAAGGARPRCGRRPRPRPGPPRASPRCCPRTTRRSTSEPSPTNAGGRVALRHHDGHRHERAGDGGQHVAGDAAAAHAQHDDVLDVVVLAAGRRRPRGHRGRLGHLLGERGAVASNMPRLSSTLARRTAGAHVRPRRSGVMPSASALASSRSCSASSTVSASSMSMTGMSSRIA